MLAGCNECNLWWKNACFLFGKTGEVLRIAPFQFTLCNQRNVLDLQPLKACCLIKAFIILPITILKSLVLKVSDDLALASKCL